MAVAVHSDWAEGTTAHAPVARSSSVLERLEFVLEAARRRRIPEAAGHQVERLRGIGIKRFGIQQVLVARVGDHLGEAKADGPD